MFKLFDLRERAKGRSIKVVVPEIEDERVLAGVKRAVTENVVGEVIVPYSLDIDLGVKYTCCTPDNYKNEVPESVTSKLLSKGVDWKDKFFFSSILVRLGIADAAIMGANVPTAITIKSALYCVGLEKGIDVLSSCFLIELPDGRNFVYSDCGVVPDPTSDQLADIAVSAAESCRKFFGLEPVVALLSFSTKGSASHPLVEKVQIAYKHLLNRDLDFEFDGELQFDAAVDIEVGKRKAPTSSIVGRANVFIFPDLNCGNIAYKITQKLANARAIGPVLQGLAKPVHDLSRGCSKEDVFDLLCVAALDSK